MTSEEISTAFTNGAGSSYVANIFPLFIVLFTIIFLLAGGLITIVQEVKSKGEKRQYGELIINIFNILVLVGFILLFFTLFINAST